MPVYLVGGGYFKFTTDQLIVGETIFPSQSEITWTVGGGGGFDIQLSTVLALFVEGKYGIEYTQDEQSHYLWGNVGVKLER